MSLSDKIDDPNTYVEDDEGWIEGILHVGDVREAIKEIINKIEKYPCDIGIRNDLIQEIRKIVGKDIINYGGILT